MLDITPHPVFSSTAGHCDHVPASGPGAPGSISESEVDIDELNPDKGMCKLGSMTEDDSANNLSISLVLPPKRTYAEVVSPRGKGKAGLNALATSSTVAVKQKIVYLDISDTESDFPHLLHRSPEVTPGQCHCGLMRPIIMTPPLLLHHPT